MTTTENAALDHGGELIVEAGRPRAVRDRHGTVWAELRWQGARLVDGALRLPDGGAVTLATGAGEHPLFGAVDRVASRGAAGEVECRCGAVDWAAPAHIPPLDRPGRLPAGAGSAVLGLLALLAARAGRAALRYRGPYPTDALWATLLDAFRPCGDVLAAHDAFVAGGLPLALSGAMHEVPVDLAPAPFVREAIAPGVTAQLRDGLEVLWIDGAGYRAGAGDGRRLVREGGAWRATLVVGGAPWCDVAWLSDARDRLERAAPPPALAAPRAIDEPLRRGLFALALADAPAPLAAALAALDPPLWIGDPGLALAARARDGSGLIVHAGLVDRLDGDALVRALAAAVAPLARGMAQDALAGAFAVAARDA
jgi:hypothetical protein